MSALNRQIAAILRASHLLFFFQAEDGIRDIGVTGVQTCALPISARHAGVQRSCRTPACRAADAAAIHGGCRSEERRVGKESRARRAADSEKIKSVSTTRKNMTHS